MLPTMNDDLTLAQLKELLKQRTIEQRDAKRKFYEAIDWTKSNVDLAAEHDCSFQTIRAWRFKLGKHRTVRQTKYWPAAKSWDWSLSDAEIARVKMVSISNVQKYRKLLNKPNPPRDCLPRRVLLELPKRKTKNNYATLDWNNKADVELARETGLTRERIRQLRAELGLPRRPSWELKYERFMKTFEGVKELSYNQAREKFPLGPSTFVDYCLRGGIKVVASSRTNYCIHPWEKVDWRLPNYLIGKIWGMKAYMVAARRCNHTLQKPEFTYVMGKFPKEWEPAVEAQRAAAEAHRNATTCAGTPAPHRIS